MATSKLPGSKQRMSALSGRAMASLLQQQRRINLLLRELSASDRTLAGALAACDVASQLEMLANYLECVQEVRAGLQQLEAFLVSRISND